MRIGKIKIMPLFLEIASFLRGFLKDNWQYVAVILLAIVLFDDCRLRGKLEACQESIKQGALNLEQAQALTNTASANSSLRGRITVPPCPPAAMPNDRKCPPCGAVTVEIEGSASGHGESTGSQNQKAEIKPISAENTGNWSLWASYHVSSRFLTVGPSYRFGVYSLGAGISKPMDNKVFESFNGLEPALFVNFGPF